MAEELIKKALAALFFVLLVYMIFLFIGGEETFIYEGF